MREELLRPAIFLDRDGVINEDVPTYVRCWEEFKFLSASLKALGCLAETQYAIVVVTNQSAIGRGLVSQTAVEQINQQMCDAVASAGGRIDRVYYCPHQPSDRCICRKPMPGMLQQAMMELKLDAQRSFMIGDALSDVEAGIAAGCKSILVLTGRGANYQHLVPEGVAVYDDLEEAVEQILRKTDWRDPGAESNAM
jgi:histidinol-phosphate phosphatase family protein